MQLSKWWQIPQMSVGLANLNSKFVAGVTKVLQVLKDFLIEFISGTGWDTELGSNSLENLRVIHESFILSTKLALIASVSHLTPRHSVSTCVK